MSLSLIDTSNLITVTHIDADGYEYTTVNYDYLEDATLVTFPNNPTNGDMFLKTFPNSKIVSVSNIMVTVLVSNMYLSIEFDKDWWNAPYKTESEDKE